MSAAALLARYRSLGAEVEADGDELVIRPQTPLTKRQIAEFRRRKPDLLDELRRESLPTSPAPTEEKREKRRQHVFEMLADAPGSVRYAWDVDAESDPHYVIVALAIRDVGSCELSILRERYDPFGLLELIERSAGEAAANSVARRSGGS